MPRMVSERLAHVENDSSREIQELRCEVKLAMEQRKASMVYTMRSMMADFIRDSGISEQGLREYTAQVDLAEASVGRSPCVVRLSNNGGPIRPLSTP